MNRLFLYIACLVVVCVTMISCADNYTSSYYRKNSNTINSIHAQYKKLYPLNPFTIEFKDKTFNYISFEILRDTIRYIYKFRLDETDLADTLFKYGYDAKAIVALIDEMRTVRCTWINKMDFYVNRQKEYMIYLSVRQKRFAPVLKAEKYYIISFFNEKQYFDRKRRLVEKPGDTEPMKINYAIYRRITDNICFAVTENFR